MAVKVGIVSTANQGFPRTRGAPITHIRQERVSTKCNESLISTTPSPAATTRQNTQAEVSSCIQSRLPLWDDDIIPV
jgi:hypothetical protein